MPTRKLKHSPQVAALNEFHLSLTHGMNQHIAQHSAVQQIIHRLVFIRFLQTGRLGTNSLRDEAREGTQVSTWQDFQALCQQLNEIYPNSVFRHDPVLDDPLQPSIHEQAFSAAWERVYSKLNFHQLDVFELGAIYEQHLHAVSCSTNESKMLTTRKARGVYYTPRHVVEYIVEHTIGRAIAGKSPEEIATLRFADIACGAGAFLLGAYEYLVRYVTAWFRTHPHELNSDAIEPNNGSWQLSAHYKSRILRENLFAVDLDPQAVEVAKMSLQLKMLEDEPLANGKHLPRLDANIRCGNALLGTDYATRTMQPHERELIKPFDWSHEFPAIMQEGGFHAILGNPPYVKIRLLTQLHGPEVKAYYRQHYRCAYRGYDLYVLFIERSHQLLTAGGHWGMIVPNKIATLEYAEKCRELLQTTTLHQIVNLSAANVFPALEVYPYIILWTKNRPATDHYLTYFEAHSVLELNSPRAVQTIRQTELHASQGWQFHGSLNVEARVKTAPLSSLATLHCGTPGFSAQQIAQALCEAGEQVGANVFDFIVSGNIDRYAVRLGNVRYMQRDFVRPVLPQAHPVLSANKRQLFAGAKIVIAGMTKRLEALLDPALLDHGSWALGVQVFAVANVQEDMRYVLGLLNSKLMSYLFRTRFHAKQLARGFLAINKGQLAQLPIRMIDGHQSAENAMYAELLQRVDRLLLLHASVDNNQAIAAEIAATDSQIDELVYRLYELTPTEIEQVEAGYVQGAEEQKRRSLIF